MNVKEHINSLKELITCKGCTLEISQETVNTLKELIELLKRGEKFKKMWKRFYKEWGEYPIELHNIAEFMEDIKKEYFPKEE